MSWVVLLKGCNHLTISAPLFLPTGYDLLFDWRRKAELKFIKDKLKDVVELCKLKAKLKKMDKPS